jgi:hypothetical protein
MPLLTALLHTHNDALRLGRALETLYACDEIVVLDRASRDTTVHVAQQYGARVVPVNHKSPACSGYSALGITSGWIFCLSPYESVSESLGSSLLELKVKLNLEPGAEAQRRSPAAYAVFLRDETPQGWIDHATPQTRLVPYAWSDWTNDLPTHDPSAETLAGELLRFELP